MNLYLKHLYLNKNIEIMVSKPIIEYDIREAGYSLCKEYQLLPEKTVKFLETKDKEYRKIFIGKRQRKDKKFGKDLMESFTKARELFFKANNIDDDEVLSIKKDAVFMMRSCTKLTFGNITFVPKNTYSSYMTLETIKPQLEMYYNRDKIDIKGIDDELLEKHKDFMISIINRVFYLLETTDKSSVLRYLRNVIDEYKGRKLDVHFYREFNSNSKFILLDDDENQYDEYWVDRISDIDITFNYFNVLVKMVELIL